MTAWIMGIYFVGFGLCFLFLLVMAGIGSSPGLSGLGSDAVTSVMLGSFLWPVLLVISIMAGGYIAIKRLLGKEKNGLRNTA